MKKIFFSLALTLLLTSFASAQEKVEVPTVVVAFDISDSMHVFPSARWSQVETLEAAYRAIAETECIQPHRLVVGFWANTVATVLSTEVNPRDRDDTLERVVPAIAALRGHTWITIKTGGTAHAAMEHWVNERMNPYSVAIISTDEYQHTRTKPHYQWYGVAFPAGVMLPGASYFHFRPATEYFKQVAETYQEFPRTLDGVSDYVYRIIKSNLGGSCYIG